MLLLVCNLNAQDFYCISSTLGDNGNRFRDDAYMLKINKKKIDTVFRLSSELEEIRFIKYFPQINMIFYVKENIPELPQKIILGKIDTKNLKLDSIIQDIKYGHLSVTTGPTIAKCTNTQYDLLLNIIGDGNDYENYYYKVDIKTLKYKNTNSSCYSKAVMVGEPGGALLSMDMQNIFFNIVRKKVFALNYQDSTKSKEFEFQIPDSIISKWGSSLAGPILNTEEIYCSPIITKNSKIKKDSAFITLETVLVNNKKISNWKLCVIKGDQTRLRAMGTYIVGLVTESTISDFRTRMIVIKTKSSGYEYRKMIGSRVLYNFDKRCNELSFYQPGILFIIDTESGKQIEWETGQGDSEILLIQNSQIFYRVYDKIYKRSLVNGKLGIPSLVAKDKLLIDVHWMWQN